MTMGSSQTDGSGLKVIDMSWQGMTGIQQSLFHGKNFAYHTRNMFSTIDIGFYNLTIKVLMNAIISILGKDIGELNLSNNNLRTIPPDIRRLTQLVKLDLSRNGLRCLHSQDYTGLPAEMSQLISLEIICISECNLPFIPPVIWKLTSLKVNQNIILII